MKLWGKRWSRGKKKRSGCVEWVVDTETGVGSKNTKNRRWVKGKERGDELL